MTSWQEEANESFFLYPNTRSHQKGYSEETDLESKFGDNTQEWEEVRRQIKESNRNIPEP